MFSLLLRYLPCALCATTLRPLRLDIFSTAKDAKKRKNSH